MATKPTGTVVLQEMSEVHLLQNLASFEQADRDPHQILGGNILTTTTNKSVRSLNTTKRKYPETVSSSLECVLFNTLENFMNTHVNKIDSLSVFKQSISILSTSCSETVSKERHLQTILRIQPVIDTSSIIDQDIIKINQNDTSLQCGQDSSNISPRLNCNLLSPYQAFICDDAFKTLNSTCLTSTSNFYIELLLVPNPLRQTTKTDLHNDDAKLGLNVRIIPHSVWSRRCGKFCEHSIAVNPIVMEQLNIQQGERVRVSCFHRPLESLQMIVLHTNQKMNIPMATMQSCFENYLSFCLTDIPSFLINQGTLLHFRDNGMCQSAVLELFGVKNTVFAEIERSNFSQIVCYVDNSEHEDVFQREVYSPFQDVRTDISNLGGLDKAFEKATSHVFRTLFCPNCSTLQEDSAVCCHGALLIHGNNHSSSGCGKTSLALSVCSVYQKQPYFCHVERVDCISLRGKRVETICEKWIDIYKDCLWKQPSIIVFDDLDQLLLQTDPLQEGGASVIYSIRLVDAFKAFTKNIYFEGCKVSIIATASCLDTLNIEILPEAGCNIFTEFVNIFYDSSELRQDIFNKVVDSIDSKCKEKNFVHCNSLQKLSLERKYKKDFKVSLSEFEKKDIVKTFDDFSPTDIIQVIKRTSHRAIMDKDISEDDKSIEDKTDDLVKPQIIIKLEHFLAASKDCKPSSITSLNLHKPDPVHWSDVGGLYNVKSILTETLLWPAKYPTMYKSCGIRMRSGLLLYGAPGTAKTLIATAVAQECGLNVIGVKGPELLNKYVGSSEQNVRDLFARAHAAQPCIIFFDEFDSLAPRRGHDNTGVTDRVVNQLLTQLDGVESLGGVYILAATSRPDLIDPALLRPGRLDKCVFCPMPDAAERLEILTIIARQLNIVNIVDLNKMAEETEGFSGADLKALVYNAQVDAVHSCIDECNLSTSQESPLEVRICFILTNIYEKM